MARAVTRVSVLNPFDYDQVGPVMKQTGIWKVKDIRDEISRSDVTFINPLPETSSVGISYGNSGSSYVATVTTEQGRILCKFCTLAAKPISWCMHIQYLAKNNADGPLFTVSETTDFMVPIVPTDGVYAPVKIGPSEFEGYFDVSMALTEVFPNPDGEKEVCDVPMGIVHGGFGLMELRSMVVDFMEGWMSNSKYFHQSAKGGSTPRDAEISAFSNRFYVAITGETLGRWEARNRHSDDAPLF